MESDRWRGRRTWVLAFSFSLWYAVLDQSSTNEQDTELWEEAASTEKTDDDVEDVVDVLEGLYGINLCSGA